MRYVNVSSIHVYTASMNPTPNGCTVLQRFEHGNAFEIHNEIMFDFYPVCHK